MQKANIPTKQNRRCSTLTLRDGLNIKLPGWVGASLAVVLGRARCLRRQLAFLPQPPLEEQLCYCHRVCCLAAWPLPCTAAAAP